MLQIQDITNTKEKHRNQSKDVILRSAITVSDLVSIYFNQKEYFYIDFISKHYSIENDVCV